MLCKLTTCIDKSVAVVAAYTNCDVYSPSPGVSYDSASEDDGCRAGGEQAAAGAGLLGDSAYDGGSDRDTRHGSGGSSSESEGGPIAWNWLASGSPRNARKRSLVGFVRAGGDGSLVRGTACFGSILFGCVHYIYSPRSASMSTSEDWFIVKEAA
jgi:hypothetical protein